MDCTLTPSSPFKNAADYGFSPRASGLDNARALQKATLGGGTVVVSEVGTYRMAATVYLGSHTTLMFGNGVFLQKVEENGPFTQVFLNQGALTKTFDQSIHIHGLHLIVNGVDVRQFEVYGLHGQVAFFYIKDLRIERFRCYDLGKSQYGIHICTFEDVIVDDVIIHGDKDGVHFGRGNRFTVRNGVFRTYDDAIALNAHDYATGNPELGWIENGIIENCHDLADGKPPIGFFCRILAGAWIDWRPGMEVQHSDTVVSANRLYRVQAAADGTTYTSRTAPAHATGSVELDGINWAMVQADAVHTAGVRNVTFRDIFLEKSRMGFSIHFDNDRYSRSYYPGAPIPRQEQIALENVRVLHDETVPLLGVGTPVDGVTVLHSSLRNNGIRFYGLAPLDYGATQLHLIGCVFAGQGPLELIENSVPGKRIGFKTSASTTLHSQFSATFCPGEGHIQVQSDLPGLVER